LGIDVTRTDVLKMLLYAPDSSGMVNSPVKGKTRLQKEVFLAQKALEDSGVKWKRRYGFRPYFLGPFSRQLYFDVKWLEKKGLVEENVYFVDEKGVYREFKLTPDGVREVERLVQGQESRKIYETVSQVKRAYGDMQLRELVEFTHREFPAYLCNHQ
jgi:uncharacterized protein YwgA